MINHVFGKLSQLFLRTRTRGLRQGWTLLKTTAINGYVRLNNRLRRPGRAGCPCCGWQGYDFLWLDCGNFTVPHARCPNCGAQERHRFVHHFLRNRYVPPAPIERCTVLHFAPEHHVYEYFQASKNPRYIGVDYARYMIWNFDFPVAQLDMQALPFPDNTFDVIICFHVLEHVPDDRKGLEELFRVLSPQGQAIIIVPMMMGQKHTIEYGKPDPEMFDHVRGYSPCDFAERLQLFRQVDTIYPSDILTQDLLRRHAIPNDSQIIYLCKK